MKKDTPVTWRQVRKITKVIVYIILLMGFIYLGWFLETIVYQNGYTNGISYQAYQQCLDVDNNKLEAVEYPVGTYNLQGDFQYTDPRATLFEHCAYVEDHYKNAHQN